MANLKENIDQSLDLLFKVEGEASKKNDLLEKPKVVYLHVLLFRMALGPSPVKKYVNLRHSFHGDNPEICLFVPNRNFKIDYKISTEEFIDLSVDYYTQFLEKHKVKGITTVMPLKQLRSEFGPYEMRRKLVRKYDLFLCKNTLLKNPDFISSLGKIFIKASREPLGIPFPKEESDFDPRFQKNVDRAISTAIFTIRHHSENYTIPFGTLSHSKSELKENLETVLDQLISKNMIPGGITNIKRLSLYPSQSKLIPLFINPELPPKWLAPKITKAKKRKIVTGVEGELSTQPGKKVVVMPNGEVFVTSIKNKKESNVESESDDSFEDGSEAEEEEEQDEEF